MKKLIVMHIIGNNEKQIYECEDKNLIKQFLDIEDYFAKLDFIDDKIMITKYFKSTEHTTIYEDLQTGESVDLSEMTLLVLLQTHKLEEPELLFYV